jgi:hypothetical protein
MKNAAKKTILRIELWQALLLLTLVVSFWQSKLIDRTALFLGGVFMGVNFLLLSFGVAWVLTPLASRGRVRAGVGLLVLKIVLFLALTTALFFRFDLDAISFALGFSTLLAAILFETLRKALRLET